MTMAGLLDLFQNCVVFALKQGRIIHTHLPVDENQSSLFPSTFQLVSLGKCYQTIETDDLR
jgi:hypothetical protein